MKHKELSICPECHGAAFLGEPHTHHPRYTPTTFSEDAYYKKLKLRELLRGMGNPFFHYEKGRIIPERTCACGVLFTPNKFRPYQKFHSLPCAVKQRWNHENPKSN